ncbi:hypothetical protein FHL15_010997 [Xylaria flabelliformis]|uniref:Uncharacterized protein n=1 Tax=Xylaria flabelliformis TaxID=2512241 RepID=A0A553HJH2_9PEZI|nr:hypothetical protein FHL15_010997 [Xylaria flabelliformis]
MANDQLTAIPVAFEVPIRDLEPLQTLNAFRRDLGLGRSSNLISSAIYDYDPTTVAECYEKSITGGFPRCPQYFPSAQHQTEVGFLECFGAPIDGSTSDYETITSSLSYQHSIDTRPSTAQRSSDGNSVDTCPDHATPADQQHDPPRVTKDE